MSPLALQTQTCQKNNLVLKTMVRDKFIFSSIRLKEVPREIQAIERSCVCFVCPVIFIHSNGHTLCLSLSETIEGNCLCMSALALKKLLEGKMGNQKKLRIFLFSSYVYNYTPMKKLDAYLHWKQCKGIFSLFWPMHHSNPPPSNDTTSVTS